MSSTENKTEQHSREETVQRLFRAAAALLPEQLYRHHTPHTTTLEEVVVIANVFHAHMTQRD